MAHSYKCDKKQENKIKEENKKKIFSILIVDDDVDVGENLKVLLSLRGHNTVFVDDGIRCISHCRDKDKYYDIIFLDYHMDGLDGAQVAEIVKEKNKKTLIFAYTGDNSEKAIDDFKHVGMDGAIIKPIDIPSIEMLMTKLEQSNCLDKNLIRTISRKSANSILIFE